tara:strand:- start:412 stop:528 length:117 start_codon:yes stop_codon:yes gene_type:complete
MKLELEVSKQQTAQMKNSSKGKERNGLLSLSPDKEYFS